MLDHDSASAIGSLWQTALGREVSVDEDFFDAGGTSLLAVELVAALSQRLGIELSPDLLIEHPTIAAVTEFVRSARTSADRASRLGAADARHLPIQLTRGVDSQALFLVHPVGGLAYFYGHLAERLRNGPRVFCFQARGLLAGEEPHRQVEAMAHSYVEGLLSVHSGGPYWLGGASFGGTVAFEMAQQLHTRGRAPEGVVLIDTPGPSQYPPPIEGDDTITEYLMGVQAESGTDPRRFGLADASDPARALRERPELQRIVRVFDANMKAMFDYTPQPYPGRIVYFRALERRAGLDPPHPERPWIDLALGGIEIHQVAGNHISMNVPPHVDRLAQIVAARLDSGRR
jgi:thioesterase domain-containing protein/acyl carrier protein